MFVYTYTDLSSGFICDTVNTTRILPGVLDLERLKKLRSEITTRDEVIANEVLEASVM